MAISGLGLKITAPIVLISALAIALTAFLNLGKFQKTFTELEQSRLRFVVNDLRANLETGLALGLPLKGLANAQAVIDFEAKKDPAILSITVYDETGAVVFHTGQPLKETNVPKTWGWDTQEKRHWQLNEPGALVIGTALSSIIGAQSGGLALRYSRHAYDGVVQSVSGSLVMASFLAVCITALTAIFGINLLVTRTKEKMRHIENALEQTATGEQTGENPRHIHPGNRLIDGVILSSQQAMHDLTLSQDALRTSLNNEPRAPTE